MIEIEREREIIYTYIYIYIYIYIRMFIHLAALLPLPPLLSLGVEVNICNCPLQALSCCCLFIRALFLFIHPLGHVTARRSHDGDDAFPAARRHTVSFHNFKSQNFKLSVSDPKSKYVVCFSVLSQISNCQSLGRKHEH